VLLGVVRKKLKKTILLEYKKIASTNAPPFTLTAFRLWEGSRELSYRLRREGTHLWHTLPNFEARKKGEISPF
jgi:hypothetical protein